MEICYSCMSTVEKGQPCYRCGHINGAEETPVHHLAPGSILNGKYIIGKAIGEGGFGITYVGRDLNLERKVAIKEYFPSGLVTRNMTDTVTIFTGDSEKCFYEGRDKFVNEAKTLAKMDKLPGMVSVIDFFLENGTSYIVMEFIEGRSLKDILQEHDRMDSEEVFHMLRSLIKSLQEIHKLGIIHRDISPDNIMITTDSEVKLIDFGAARSLMDNKSLSIQLKPGYAPEEQYRTHGEQGSWTDVYALCATMYKAITGTLPPEALERIKEDHLKTPSELGIKIDRNKEAVLMRGLALYRENRLRDMQELYEGLYNGAEPPPVHDVGAQGYKHQYSAGKEKNGKVLYVFIIICTLAVVCGIVFSVMKEKGRDENASSIREAATEIVEVTAESTELPTEEPMEPTELLPEKSMEPGVERVRLYSLGLKYNRMPEIHNSEESDDAVFISMEEFISYYVILCDNYMNYGSEEIFEYLLPGTTAYSQQTGYKKKHPSLTQNIISCSIQDVRQFGSYYYVWDTEELSETENGLSKNTISHWVYKIDRTNDLYKVVDYTYDPTYK